MDNTATRVQRGAALEAAHSFARSVRGEGSGSDWGPWQVQSSVSSGWEDKVEGRPGCRQAAIGSLSGSREVGLPATLQCMYAPPSRHRGSRRSTTTRPVATMMRRSLSLGVELRVSARRRLPIRRGACFVSQVGKPALSNLPLLLVMRSFGRGWGWEEGCPPRQAVPPSPLTNYPAFGQPAEPRVPRDRNSPWPCVRFAFIWSHPDINY